jgi:hypothetical protein
MPHRLSIVAWLAFFNRIGPEAVGRLAVQTITIADVHHFSDG